MLKILAVSDERCESLITTLQSNIEYFRKNLNLVISCGDVRPSYVELLASILNKMIYYVEGNHYSVPSKRNEILGVKVQGGNFAERVSDGSIPGGINLHANYIEEEKFRLAGFGGSYWYNGEGKQYREGEMSSRVNSVMRKVRFRMIKNYFTKKTSPPLIAVSHAPIYKIGDERDNVHRGFKSFRAFARKASPVLWLYGHKHLKHYSVLDMHGYKRTVAINCFGYKFISLSDSGKISASFHPEDLWDDFPK